MVRANANELRDFFHRNAYPTSVDVNNYTLGLFEKAKLQGINTTLGSLRRHFNIWRQYR